MGVETYSLYMISLLKICDRIVSIFLFLIKHFEFNSGDTQRWQLDMRILLIAELNPTPYGTS